MSQGSPVPLLKFQMAPRLGLLTSSGSKKKEPKCTCLSEARASQSHKTWIEVSSSTPHHLHKGLQLSPIKSQGVMSSKEVSNNLGLCPIKGKKSGLSDWTRARNYFLSLSLCSHLSFSFYSAWRRQSRCYKCNMKQVPYRGLTSVKHYCTKFSHHDDWAPRVCASLVYTRI